MLWLWTNLESCCQAKSKWVKPITRRQILDSSKLKEFADDNFKFDENGRKLSKWVENICGEKEKLLVTSNFSLWTISPFFHSVFKRLVSQGCQKVSLCGNGLTLSQTSPGLYMSGVKAFWKHLLKTLGEKEKLLLTSNSSFSHNVFYPLGQPFATFIKLKIVVCKLFQFEKV